MVSFWTNPTTKDAYRLSIASIVIELIAIIVGFVIYKKTLSSLSLVYGLENIVDVISSIVVLWRFFAPSTVDDELERKLKGREEQASIVINWILVNLGVFIILNAISGFARGRNNTGHDDNQSIIISSFISTIVFGTICTIKFRFSRVLDSESLYKDGLCSLIGTVLSAAMFIHAAMFAGTALWWIDPFLSLLAGIFAMYYGATSLSRGPGFCCWGSSTTSNSTNQQNGTTTSSNTVELGTAPNAINDNDIV